MNAGIQGLAADIFKVALVRLDEALEDRRRRHPGHPPGPRRDRLRGPRRRGRRRSGAGRLDDARRRRAAGAARGQPGLRRLVGGRQVAVTDDHGRWFTPLADHMQRRLPAVLVHQGHRAGGGLPRRPARASTRGSVVLDAGCGPGRHVRALRSGASTSSGWISPRASAGSVAAGDPPAPAVVADIRALPVRAGLRRRRSRCARAASACSAGPGAPVDADVAAVVELAGCLRPGGRLVLSAFSSYFQVRFQDGPRARRLRRRRRRHARADAGQGRGRRRPRRRPVDHRFTPRELRFLARLAGLEPEHVWSVDPGDYARRSPDLDHAEFLLVARKPT